MSDAGTHATGRLDAQDERYLRRTLRLARRGAARVSPNPMVGAVLVRDGEILAEGHHHEVGGAHAEIDALDRLEDEADARGATLYVNLEPCSHHGRTPPCADRVIEAGIRRVVLCHRDPNPEVDGGGLAKLRAAGVEIAVGGPVEQALAMNLPFLVSRLEQRVAVTLKWAMSLDGKIATRTGDSQWISSPRGRRWALELRETHDAILVGSETALQDDPRLTRRLGRARGPISRVVLDRRLRLPASAAMLAEPGPALVYTEARDSQRRRDLEQAGAEVVVVERVTPGLVCRDLALRGHTSLLVEGGGEVLEAFRSEGCFDRVAICLAPLLIGGREAAPAFGGIGAELLGEASGLESIATRRRGPDLVVEALRRGLLTELREATLSDSGPGAA